MAGYYDETAPMRRPPPGPPDRWPINANRLWAGGLATAVVAALVALVGVLVVRAVFRVGLYAPAEAGAFGDSDTLLLCVIAALAALVATGLAHLLLLATPRPLSYLSWIIGLATTAAAVVPFIADQSLGVALAKSAIHLAVGLCIGSLTVQAAAAAMRPVGGRPRQRFEIE
jgi:hypothetical protein